MADKDNIIRTKVELDATQAQQEIVKLNAKAANSTKTLEERLAAKNKQIELQEKLSKQTIAGLEKEIKLQEQAGASAAKVTSLRKKLNSEKVKATKLTENNAKAQEKLSEAFADSKKSTVQLDDATGGLLGKMKAFATNPIGLVIIALGLAFKAITEAIGRSSKASETFGKIGAKLSGIMNGLLAVLEPVVEFIGEKLLYALENPQQALKDLGNFIQESLINRVKGFLVLGEAFSLLLEGEWSAAAKKATDAVIQIGTGVTDATDKLEKFAEVAKKKFDEAADATERLANAEKSLAKNRIALEKQQLKSLQAAEKERQIRDDISKSIEERIAANERLGKILDDQLKRELALAQQNLNLARLQQKATGDTIENLEAVGDAEIKLLEIQERITGQRSEQLTNTNALLKEQEDLKKAALDNQLALDQLEIDAKRRKNEETFQLELDLIEKTRKARLDNERLTKEEIALINAEADAKEEEARIAKKERDAEEKQRGFDEQVALDELEIERKRALGESTLELELELLERKRLQDVEQADLSAAQIQAINEKAALAKAKLRKIEEAAEKKQKEIVTNNALDGAAEVFGISQEVAVAKMIMAAPQAVADSFKNAAAAYNPPIAQIMGALGAATVIVPIIKGLADIKKVRFGKKSKGGGAGGSISTSTSAPAGVGTASVSDLAANNAARLGVDPSIGGNAAAEAANNITGGASANVVFSESRYGDFQNQVAFREERSSL